MAIESEKLKILAEKLPTRCEVCHKTDEYDPETNICLRCLDFGSQETPTNIEFDENQIQECLPTERNTLAYLSSYTDQSYSFFGFDTQKIRNKIRNAMTATAIALTTFTLLSILFYGGSFICDIANSYSQTPTSESSIANQENSTEVEPPTVPDKNTPYQVDIDLQNIDSVPPIALSLNNVTIVELNDAPVSVINGNNETLEVQFSPSSKKRLYLIGKKPCLSGNVIFELKNNGVFTLFFEVRDTKESYEDGFNGLIKIN